MSKESIPRVALIGCGAISQQMHLPVLGGHDGLQLAAVVDRDLKRAKQIAREYGVETFVSDISELNLNEIDAAIVATPPFHHAPCSLELMKQGIHVLVEKPMATEFAAAQEMVRVSEETETVLHVGVFRRLYPSLRLLHGLVKNEELGQVLSFSLESGGEYGWNAATLGNVQKSLAGGGILMDMGPHHLDQLFAVFDGPAELISYRDDTVDGCEADCVFELQLQHNEKPVQGTVSLSRTRSLRNSLRVECENGYFDVGFSERYSVDVCENSQSAFDSVPGNNRPVKLTAQWENEPEVEWYQTFRSQIDDWLNAIQEKHLGMLTAHSCLLAMKVIDDCYQRREKLCQPWLDGISFSKLEPDVKRVLITGASGFIGCRVAEAISQDSDCEIRAMVRSPGNAARLARLGVEMVQADLTDKNDVAKAVADCDAIIHCAVGTDYWSNSAVAKVTIGGTQNLLNSALKADVSRFVHISSIAVHNSNETGTINEETPANPAKVDHYGHSKLKAEKLVQRAINNGLNAVILRPGCVYGPYGKTFTTRPLEALVANQLCLAASRETPSNTVYVDNLVEAILNAVNLSPKLSGEVFTISDGESVSWGEFYAHFAKELNSTLRYESGDTEHVKQRDSLKLFGVAEVVRSSEFRSLLRKIAYTPPLGIPLAYLVESFPGFTDSMKRRLGGGGATVFRPEDSNSVPELRITSRAGEISIEKSSRMLQFTPIVSSKNARERTLDWWKFHNSK